MPLNNLAPSPIHKITKLFSSVGPFIQLISVVLLCALKFCYFQLTISKLVGVVLTPKIPKFQNGFFGSSGRLSKLQKHD
jgi:hypothetical protein